MERFEKKVPDTFTETVATIIAGIFVFVFSMLGIFMKNPDIFVIVAPVILIIIYTWLIYYPRFFVCAVEISAENITITWRNRKGKEKQVSRPVSDLFYVSGSKNGLGGVVYLTLSLRAKKGGSIVTVVAEDGWTDTDLQAMKAAFEAVGIQEGDGWRWTEVPDNNVVGEPAAEQSSSAVVIPQLFEPRRPGITWKDMLFIAGILLYCIAWMVKPWRANLSMFLLIGSGCIGFIISWIASFFRMGVYRIEVKNEVVTVWWKNRAGNKREETCEVNELYYQLGFASPRSTLETIFLVKKKGYKSFVSVVFMGVVDGRDGWVKYEFAELEAAFKAVGIQEIGRDKFVAAVYPY
ncbi:hypothetical protein [Chitinophaga sp. Cy-1792]|uniref:hypothetical protein n=1 Tax=Chitinophaga sp. Cy-1792 TaxID=2608339 RepID=UPI00142225B8|nr:hypothetical protein [Chitinophaga sp. Cy-1792]NIG55251.1 hypothetical protein [Chitinophaga sp. Cy-1792]